MFSCLFLFSFISIHYILFILVHFMLLYFFHFLECVFSKYSNFSYNFPANISLQEKRGKLIATQFLIDVENNSRKSQVVVGVLSKCHALLHVGVRSDFPPSRVLQHGLCACVCHASPATPLTSVKMLIKKVCLTLFSLFFLIVPSSLSCALYFSFFISHE